jgi:plasmid stabilization system protein ParE
LSRPTLRFTQSAESDLNEIWSFVAHKDGLDRADHLVDRLRDSAQKLCRTPGLGRPWPHRPGARVVSSLNFMFLYYASSHEITVVHVVHAARDLPPIFGLAE